MEIMESRHTKTAWLGEVPSHWEIKRLGGLFEERNEIVSENDYAPLSVTMKGIVPQLESAAKTMHVDNRKKVCVGDFAINSRSDRRGSGGLSFYEGSVSIVNTVLKPSKFYVHEYTHYLLTNKLFQDEYYAKGKGIVADMWSTRFSEMKTIYLPVPPKDEQDEIVQYIKAQEEKINLFIQKKQRFIELLKEQRQRVITLAVTKGIKNEQLKDSQIDWLGEIPKSWERTALKRLVKIKITDGPHESPVFADEGIPFVSAEASVNGRIDLNRKRCDISKELHEEYCKKAKAEFGDILMVKSGSTTGKIAIVDFHDEFSIWSPLALIRPNESINNEFLFYSLSSNYFQKQVQLNWSFGTQPNIGMGKIEQLIVLYPNSLEEQKQIVSHIKTETATLDTAIAKAEREIELIREYKEAMIAEAVMGKRK